MKKALRGGWGKAQHFNCSLMNEFSCVLLWIKEPEVAKDRGVNRL